MGKCYFDPDWLDEARYKDWLAVDSKTRENFLCNVCNQSYIIGTSGIKALESHMKTNKHNSAKSSKSIFSFMSIPRSQNQKPKPSVATGPTQQPSQTQPISSTSTASRLGV